MICTDNNVGDKYAALASEICLLEYDVTVYNIYRYDSIGDQCMYDIYAALASGIWACACTQVLPGRAQM